MVNPDDNTLHTKKVGGYPVLEDWSFVSVGTTFIASLHHVSIGCGDQKSGGCWVGVCLRAALQETRIKGGSFAVSDWEELKVFSVIRGRHLFEIQFLLTNNRIQGLKLGIKFTTMSDVGSFFIHRRSFSSQTRELWDVQLPYKLIRYGRSLSDFSWCRKSLF